MSLVHLCWKDNGDFLYSYFFFIFFHPTFSDQNPEFNIYTPFYIGLICIGPHFASSETLPSLSLYYIYFILLLYSVLSLDIMISGAFLT